MTLPLPIGLPCPLKSFTGLDCPLCGATRATFALFRGHLATAFDFNPLYVSLLPVLAVLAVMWAVTRRQPAVLQSPWLPKVALVVAVAYGVIRNLPFAPFDYLGT